MSPGPTASSVAGALGGHRVGDGYLVRCPVRGHGRGNGDRRPSLHVKDGDHRLLVHCFAGCDARDVLDALGARDMPIITEVPMPRAHVPANDFAVRIWRETTPATGTIADAYLTSWRGLRGPFPPSLRFVRQVQHPRNRQVFAALAARVATSNEEISAVQLTFLTTTGTKAPVAQPRWTYGLLSDGAVRLGPVGETIGIAEGVEDALAASQLSQLSCWACLGAARMHRIHLPDEVRELHVFADDDEAGRRAADRTADVHQGLGRRVVVRLPPAGFKDWGEIAAARAPQTVAA